MAHIKVKKGLDIPIKGKPKGNIQTLSGSPPKQIALNLDPFGGTRFRLLAKRGDAVKIGQPLAEDKLAEGRVFASPASGVISEVRRGLKRRILDIVIDVGQEEQFHEISPLDPEKASAEQIVEKLKAGGLFAHIRSRPFNSLASPNKTPRSIFVKAIESAPFVPPAELQVEGYFEEFQLGLNALTKLTSGPVHLVYHKDSSCTAFTQAENVQKHTAEGPHPIGNASVHIQNLDPITSTEDVVWTVTAHDVVVIGYLLKTGRYHTERVISIAGPGILPERAGYFKTRAGYPIESLQSNRTQEGLIRLISGDPLMGQKVEPDDFLGFSHYAFCAIPESVDREFAHFFRLGANKYSFSRAYLSGHLSIDSRKFDFTTSLHGEPRAFVDSTLYDKVMPLTVPTMTLVKAVMAEDYDLAEELGLLEVDSEDFALPTFVCPSKVEMTEIIKRGLQIHAAEVLE
ncbi:MAG: Na(+)-translocating NADH-quinone reductase subunit A [Chlamydiae bacterium]|nr:Na(+)-translocating NADH-quinone reductase subunit A [Chlamydiota bacterium]